MAETRINAYEGMFLFPQTVSADLQSAVDHVTEILGKGDASIVSFCKWDERRLAYDIKGNKRGVYFLCYFRCDASKLASIERDCRLSERLLRSMITRADHLTEEQMLAVEGRQQLADEIKLRAEQPAEPVAVAETVTAPSSDDAASASE
ncbi:MAG: hypothetical protein RI967_2008 [Planctomycetota bacterium]|jgi:small subunit ribosomal protein S6